MAVGKPRVGLEVGIGLMSVRSHFLISWPEIEVRIEQTLAAAQVSEAQPSELQLVLMAQVAGLTLFQGRPAEAEALLERCVAACDGDAAQGQQWRDRPETETGLPAVVDYAWGTELMMARRDPRAIAVLARAREKFHRLGVPSAEAMCEWLEALAAGFYGPAEQAMTIGQRHLERITAAGAGLAQSWAQMALAVAMTKH